MRAKTAGRVGGAWNELAAPLVARLVGYVGEACEELGEGKEGGYVHHVNHHSSRWLKW